MTIASALYSLGGTGDILRRHPTQLFTAACVLGLILAGLPAEAQPALALPTSGSASLASSSLPTPPLAVADFSETPSYLSELPYGEECITGPCASNPGVGAGQPRKFTGKERDAETGLDYFGARYYASKIGRLTTVDPVLDQQAALVNPQRWNRYAYVSNNPLRYVDPDGREQVVIVGDKTYMGGVDGMSAGNEQSRNQLFAVLTAGVGLFTPGPEDLVVVSLVARAGRFLGACLARSMRRSIFRRI